MVTLGINAVYHDSAAVLVADGSVVAAAEDERFTHVKHAKRAVPFSTWELPFHAIDYCLEEAGIELADVDHVAYSYDPDLLEGGVNGAERDSAIMLPLHPGKLAVDQRFGSGASPWDPLFVCHIRNARAQLADGAPHHLQARFRRRAGPAQRWHFVEHHLAHEASAFLAAPFAECAVLTMDGRGERATTSYGVFADDAYRRIGQVDLPDSIGLLYEEVTEYLGFLRSSDEYKVMALASYGEPEFVRDFREILRPGRGGRYHVGELRLAERFGPPRERGRPVTQRDLNIAHSLQHVLEETVVELSRWLHEETGMDCLAMAGGVALNCVMNARIRDRGPFRDVWVQPAAGDAGTALGAALWIDRTQRNDQTRTAAGADRPVGPAAKARRWQMDHAFLGPAFDDDRIEEFLRWSKIPYRRVDDIAATAARMLADERIIGWFQGRMEFGPRALGARSILASPLDARTQARLNEIKDREDFRPVAPVVLQEHAAEWFVGADVAPFMLFVFDVQPDKAALIPAVRHVDGTARVQTINRAQHPLYYDLLTNFYRLTGVPVLVNTSFNTRGEPMVCTPRDAVESFWTSPLDALCIGSFLLEKTPSPALVNHD